jgi:hypothetical protein
VLAPPKAVCDECQRKRDNKKIDKIYRVYEKSLTQKNASLNRAFSAWVLQQEAAAAHNA